ncbi:MAG: hypothetical protein IJX02_07515 [Clostridia bacterium]|nr:hypothetical protein [Clostridia bacterium]
MKKIVLTLAISVMALFILAISAFAAEYTVASDEEYAIAYESAADGDTIVVNQKLTCNIQATKDITYILRADWESSALILASGADVSFVADGGNYRIMPKGYDEEKGWMCVSEAYENVVISLAGINGGTVTVDGEYADSDRVSYVENSGADITLNLFSGSAIAGFNNTEADKDEKAYIIYAKTVNMYEGSKIYSNRTVSAPLIGTAYFNLFGGEIFGNVLQSNRVSENAVGAIFASESIITYGGKIYKNIFNSAPGGQNNMIGFFSTPIGKDVVIFDLQIGDTYVTGNGTGEVSAMFGTTYKTDFNVAKFYYNSNMQYGTRYKFTGAPVLAYDEETGKTVWTVSKYSSLSEGWNGRSWNRTDISSKGNAIAIFLDAKKKTIDENKFDTFTLINAYMNGVYAYDKGATAIAIPSGYALWSNSASDCCHTGKAYTAGEVVGLGKVTLYASYEAEKITQNGMTVCEPCGTVQVCNSTDHNHKIESIYYDNYVSTGKMVISCEVHNILCTVDAPALIECKGFSSPENGEGGLVLGFAVNSVAIEEYERVTNNSVSYGVFAVLNIYIGNEAIFNENGEKAQGVISADMTAYNTAMLELKIIGFETEEQKNAEIVMGAYVAVSDGEGTTYAYLQDSEPTGDNAYSFVTYNEKFPSNS